MQVLFLKFGRDDESEADRLGVRYMTRLDYDARELADVMSMLSQASEMQAGSGRVPEWLATHPDPANRSQAILAMAAETPGGSQVSRAAYLRRLDGMTFGPNPREGYTENGVFHHPDLEFRMESPSGWQVLNGKREVQFVAPDQSGAVILSLAEGAPMDALRDFAAQEGLRVGSASSSSVNGFEAASAPFEVETEQGVLAGEVLFLRYDGSTYRLLGVSSAQGWPAIRSPARTIMRSFARETDRAVLAVQPDRLRLVELSRATSMARFVEQYPSAVPVEIVALINHIAPGGELSAGTAKRVVDGR
jgi:predicted Zn-dependent protease